MSPQEYIELRYDKDINLYKGTLHDEFPKTSTGHKYLFSPNTTIGSISVKGLVYDSLLLKYDVYKQNLVLEYVYYPVEKRFDTSINKESRDYSKASYKIDINPALVDGFTLGKHQFVAIGETNISYPYHYLQVIPSTTLSCFIGWRKEYLIENVTMYYSDERKKVFLKMDDKYIRVMRKNKIIKELPKPLRPQVKKYCRAIKFNIEKSDVSKYYLLFEFIDNMMDSNEN